MQTLCSQAGIMAFISSSSSTNSSSRMLSLQIVLISFGVISAAVILNVSLPVLTEFVVSDLPFIWSSVILWFKPPYLYVVINCIIVALIASSKFQFQLNDEEEVGTVEIVASVVEVADVVKRSCSVNSASVVEIETDIEGAHMEVMAIAKGEEDEKILFDDLKMEAYVEGELTAMEDQEKSGFDESGVLSWNLAERSVWDEKRPRSNRFSHRKPNKSNMDGGRSFSALRVSKPKRHDTMESTWKAITEGRAMPLARHRRKSETWQDEDRRNLNSETWNNSNEELTPVPVSSRTRRKGKLKREASPGQDELNRRVEAFINKFNQEMRLQRQISLQRYKHMMRINVGGDTTT